MMAESDFKVIRIMSRCYLNCTRAKFLLDILISNNRNFTADNWKNQHFAD